MSCETELATQPIKKDNIISVPVSEEPQHDSAGSFVTECFQR